MDLANFQKVLAQNKVYDAWQYVQSLNETLTYMNISVELLEKVYAHRLATLERTSQSILDTVAETGQATVTEDAFNATNLNIAGFELNDVVFLKKTALEFFHYARLSMDVLFQIINASLFGDNAIDIENKMMVKNLLVSLGGKPKFAKLKTLLNSVKTADEFVYLQGFDNHVKHIRTVLLNVKNSFIFGDNNRFQIESFNYGTIKYPVVDAIEKVRGIRTYVNTTVEQILHETARQVPNCIGTERRIQNLNYKMQMSGSEGKCSVDHISFFIDVDNDISELQQEINVYPLIIKPNGEIYSFDFRFEEIFIKRKTDNNIVGVAKLKNGLSDKEVYRTFTVFSCDVGEYVRYLADFKQKYPSPSFNLCALEGQIIIH